MEVHFENAYTVGICVFLVVLCNLKTILHCLKDCVLALDDMACITPDCIGHQLHFCLHSFLQNIFRKLLVCYCFLQPLIQAMIIFFNQWRTKHNTASTLIFCFPIMNLTSVHYKDSRNTLQTSDFEATHSVPPSLTIKSNPCVEIDYFLICLPHAMLVSISCLLWLRLTAEGVLFADTAWDESLYSDGNRAIFLYDIAYYLETFAMNFFFMTLIADPLHAWTTLYASISVTLVILFFLNMVRYKIESYLDSVSLCCATTILAASLLPFHLKLLRDNHGFVLFICFLHILCLLVLVIGHLLAHAEATAAYVVCLRLFVTCIACTVNICILIAGLNNWLTTTD